MPWGVYYSLPCSYEQPQVDVLVYPMLPAKLVGTVVTTKGPEPFILDTPSGQVALGRWAEPDRRQRHLGASERGAIEQQVRVELGSQVQQVRVGQYCCPSCQGWVNVEMTPEAWHGDRCSACR